MLKLNTGICPIVNCNTYCAALEVDAEYVEYNLREDGHGEEVIARFCDRMWNHYDGKGYVNMLCKEAIELAHHHYINGELDSLKDAFPTIKGFEYINAYSPREYNFSGDEANFSLIGDTEAIISDCHKIIEKDEDKFFDFIHDRFGSRDGFFSYMPYQRANFWEALDKGTDVERAVAMVIAFVLNEDEVKSLYEDLIEQISGNHDAREFVVGYTVEDAQRELDIEKVEDGE